MAAAVVVVAVIGALVIVVDDEDAVSPVDSSAADELISEGTAPAEGTTPAEDVASTDGTVDSDPADTVDTGTTATTPAAGAVPPSAPPPVPVEPACTYIGLDAFDDMQVELSFLNPLGPVTSLQLDYALSDADGVRFHSGTAVIDLPGGEEYFRTSHDTVEPLPAGVAESTITCRVIEITEASGSSDVRSPGVGDGCAVVGIDGFGDVQIELTVTSPFAEETELLLTYALTSSGVRFATAVSIIAAVGGNETVRQAVDTVVAPPSWVDDVVCQLLGIESLDQ